MKLEGFVLTHEGKVRTNNEDNFNLFGVYKKDTARNREDHSKKVSGDRQVAAVFDGMGGEEAGEVASLMAAQEIAPCTIEQMEEEPRRQLLSINDEVCTVMRQNSCNMGTTAVLLYFDKGSAVCVNLGDSRAYLYRDGQLRQLSKDHSEGQRMIELGISTEEEARQSRNWHRLTQHIGIFPEDFLIEPYMSDEIILKPEDLFLLASDGLTDMVMNDDIERTLVENDWADLPEIAEVLLNKALDQGGRDNTTILLVRVKENKFLLG